MKYFMTFSYDGSAFKGYQKQNNERTIQGEIEKVLSKINSNKQVNLCATGRTDAGVHALNQKAHFVLDKMIETDRLLKSINGLLPSDIYVKKIEVINDNFHARYNVKSKEYIYKINMGEYNPVERNYVYQYNKRLDILSIERALKYFEGEHNFKSFTKCDENDKDCNRIIYQASLIRDLKNNNILTISLVGNGFLRYMVRNIVGLLIEIGEGKRKSEEVYTILNKEDRKEAGITAPPNGLYLKDVFY